VVIPLAPKVLQTLLVLVRNAGGVVKKADLIQAIWPDSFVEDTGLTRNISVLRQALGDQDQRLIVTVARIGYRFAGSVTEGRHTDEAPAKRDDGGRRLIVGRDRELDALRNAVDSARSGRGSIVALAGEPGIGKTTAATAFLREVESSCRIGIGRCSERFAGAEPHLPILEALDGLTGEPSVMETLRTKAPTWAHVIGAHAHSSDSGVEPRNSETTGSAERLMRELTIFLEDTSRHQPVIVFIDDLQWADVATVDALSHLASRVPRMRVLMVVTYRQHELTQSRHPFGQLRAELIARGHLQEVQVRLLALDDVRQYVRSAFGKAEVPSDLPAFVFRKTEGNPLFMTDLVRYVRETGIRADAGSAGDVPDSLRGLIERMMQSVDAGLRQILSIAAVQGYEFDSATLARVNGSPPADVEELLRAAEQVHGIVTLVDESELPDGALSLRYGFVHVLYQDALYVAIPPSRRIAWARQIAETLVASHAPRTDAVAGQVAVLFETGRDYWQAAQYFLVTSTNAARLFAFATAAELADRGLSCLRSAQMIDQRDMLRRELDLTFARLVPLATLLGYASAEVEQLARRVVHLGEKIGDPSATAAGLAATWIVRMVRGDCRAAKDAGQRLVALAAENGHDVLLINGHMQAQIACHHLGEFREAAECAAAVQTMAVRVPHAERCVIVFDPVVASLAESARNLWITGQLSRAYAECDRALALGLELRHPDSLAFAWLFHGWVHGYRGDWRSALASATSGIAIARESGSVQTLAWNRCVRGWALAHLGDMDEGVSELAAGIEASKAIMGQVALPQFSAMMAEVLLLRNDVAAAEEWLARAIAVEDANDDRYFSAEVHRLSAVCLARTGQIEAACAELHTALEVSRSQGARFFELRAAVALADYDSAEGREATCAALSSFPEPEPWPEIEAAQAIVR
jgi:tetratricopeptide (TPR) repeat protein